ncbi:transposase, partial [Thermodesulfobacteriota bacterium]
MSLNDGVVTFKYKNRQIDQIRHSKVTAVEFIRRFL